MCRAVLSSFVREVLNARKTAVLGAALLLSSIVSVPANANSLVISFPGDPSVSVSVTETPDGSLEFVVDQSNPNGLVADLRGLFLHINDESLISGLTVNGAVITSSQLSVNGVNNLGEGANVNGIGDESPPQGKRESRSRFVGFDCGLVTLGCVVTTAPLF